VGIPPDDHYRTGRYAPGRHLEQVAGFLKSERPKEELSGFLTQRGCRWTDHRRWRQTVESFAWAWALAPNNGLTQRVLIHLMNKWGGELWELEPPGFPPIDMAWPRRRYPQEFPSDLERDILFLEARDNILKDQALEQRWWGPMRRGALTEPVPKVARAAFTLSDSCEIRFD
jgi:hypothetical protein